LQVNHTLHCLIRLASVAQSHAPPPVLRPNVCLSAWSQLRLLTHSAPSLILSAPLVPGPAGWANKAFKAVNFGGQSEPPPAAYGQLFNRGVLLADMLGANSADIARCSCVCCINGEDDLSTPDHTSTPTKQRCKPSVVGLVRMPLKKTREGGAPNLFAHEEAAATCDAALCAKNYPLECPADANSAKPNGPDFNFLDAAGHVIAKEERIVGAPFGSLTCADSAAFVERLMKDPIGVLEARKAYHTKNHET